MSGLASVRRHAPRVVYESRDCHGYPWRAACDCGWRSWGYVAEHAAQQLADAHERGDAM